MSSRVRASTARSVSATHSRTNSLKSASNSKHSVLEDEITKQLSELSKLNARMDRSLAKLSTVIAINQSTELFRRIEDDKAKIHYISQLITRLIDTVEDQANEAEHQPNNHTTSKSKPNSGTSTPVRQPNTQAIKQSLARWRLSLERETRRSDRTQQQIDQAIKEMRKEEKAARKANNPPKQTNPHAFNGHLGERLLDQTNDDDDDEDEDGEHQLVEFIDLDEQLIEQRVKELQAMEQEVRDVAELFVQVNDLVQEQQVSIDHIDEVVENVVVDVDKGTEQVVRADVSHRRSRKCQCIVGITVLIVLAAAAAVVIFILKR